MKATNKDGKRNATTVARVVKMRDEQNLSWTKIKLALREGKSPINVSGSTVRRIYDEGKGYKGAHNDSRPLAGGRYKGDAKPGTKPSDAGKPVPKATAANTKALANSKAKAPAKRAAEPKPTAAKKAESVTAKARKASTGGVKQGAARKATKAPAPKASDKPAEEQAAS